MDRNSKTRVLYVIENTTFGGGERGFGQLSTGLNRDRFQTSVAAHPGGKLEEIARQARVPFFPVDMSRKLNLKTVGDLSRLISGKGFHVVHSMGARADFFARLACRKRHSAAVVCTVAMLVEGFDVGPFRRMVYKAADSYSARYVTQYIAVSEALKERLITERKIPANKINVIYNGVNLEQYKPNLNSSEEVRNSLAIENESPVVGTVGRLVCQKGFTYLLEAARLVYSENDQVRFVIVGCGPEEASLKQLAKSLSISDICMFVGERFDVPEFLAAFDVFVLSSILEGLPRVVIEAMAMARPIVATDIDGVREQLRNNHTGLLVPPADPKALAEAILRMLEDKERAESFGRRARKAAEQLFDLKHTLNSVETLYEKVFSRCTDH